jgi:predicted ATPase
MTQADLAGKVSCSLSMLRKIERDERRPSEQLAELLADHLAIDEAQRGLFLKMARGQYAPELPDPSKTEVNLLQAQAEIGRQQDELAPFVARQRELEQLRAHLDQAMAGQGRMVFIAGEAGRGKTSLLYEFARQSMTAQPDLVVAGGSSDVYTGLGDPLLPFRDIFRLLAGDIENAGMSGIVNRDLADRLAQAIPFTTEILLDHGPHLIDTLVPGSVLETRLAQSLPQDQNSSGLLVRLHDQRARFSSSPALELQQDRLFEEISSTLNALARQQPLLLMLDDLHWADTSTTGLLGHLAMRLQQNPILVVGSFRPEDLAHGRGADGQGKQVLHPLQEVLSESQRQFGQNRIDLDHPDPNEELNFVNALLDADDNDFGDDFRKRLARLTEGQPLFVVELLRDMKERGDIIQGSDGRWRESEPMSWEHFPARVEGVIEKRIGRLPDDLRDLLTVGSVQGETFFAEVIAQIRQVDARELTRRLSAVLDRQHRLIREQGVKRAVTERLSQYQFRHHLFQKYLYGRLAASERMYLHEDVGNALEALYAGSTNSDDIPAAQLARHFQEARLGAKASRYLLLAGKNAARVIAYDEAAANFERGLDLLADQARTPEIKRLEFDLYLALARAYWHGGHLADAFAVYEKLIEIARALNEPEALARAVLAYEEPRWRLNLDSGPSQGYLREALAALGEEQSGLRVRLLVGLSRSLLTAGEQEGLRATIDQALQIARQIDDPVALCDALRIRAQVDRRPETTADRLAAVEELIATAESIGDQERLGDALDLYVYDMLELGHIDRADEAIAAQKRTAEEIKQPFQLHVAAVFQTMRAIMRGEFEKAERLANEAAEISRQIGLAELDGILGIHMFTIRWEQGRLQEIAPILNLYMASTPESASWRPGLALIYCTLDMRDECQAIFEELVSEAVVFVPQDSLRVASLAYLTEVCAYLGDVKRAASLYEMLLPYDGRTVVVGGATACYGAAARYLGMLATIMSDWPAAERHFEGALALDARMGSRPWLAHTQCEYARMLLARGREVDRQPALALLDQALAAAQEMGMAYLGQKVTVLQAQYELA